MGILGSQHPPLVSFLSWSTVLLCSSLTCCLPTAPKIQEQLIMDCRLQIYEPKWAFSLYKLIKYFFFLQWQSLTYTKGIWNLNTELSPQVWKWLDERPLVWAECISWFFRREKLERWPWLCPAAQHNAGLHQYDSRTSLFRSHLLKVVCSHRSISCQRYGPCCCMRTSVC